MPPLLIAGRGYIASAVAAEIPDKARLVRGEDALDGASLEGVEVALWGGRHPALGGPAWRLEDEREVAFARVCAERGVHLVSLGTRKVYAQGGRAHGEADPVAPGDLYGRQKLAIEGALGGVLGGNLTRLRLANVFGREPGRRTFMGMMQDGLAREGEIRFDMSPFTRRDFLPVDRAAALIAAVLRDPPGGVLNVGSGSALECGRLALALIRGFGAGRLVITDPRERDAFVLDVTRASDRYGAAAPDIEDAAEGIGRAMRAELSADARP